MSRAVLFAIRAQFVLALGLLAAVPPLAAAPIGPGQLPQGQEIKRVYLYSRQRVVLDHLPVCVVYEPPGAAGQQDFTLTNRFGTSTKVTTLRTNGKSIAVGVSFRFLSGESEQSETWKYEQQTKTWRTVVETAGWHTAAHQFPANGDLIVFYLRPQFEITLRIGEAKQKFLNNIPQGLPYDKQFYDPPQFVEMEPLRDDDSPADPNQRTWVRVAATVGEIRQGTGNGQGLDDLKQRLLALDPFAGGEAAPAIPNLAGGNVRGRGAPSAPANPEYPAALRNRDERFWYGQSYQWSPTGPGFEAGVAVSVGQSQSNKTTHKTQSKVKLAAAPSFSTPLGEVTPSITGESTFSLEYSVNSMTESEHTTDARATIGGGDGSDGSRYMTDQYYDATFGTLAFTRERVGGATAMGIVDGGNGSPAGAGTQVMATEQKDGGRRIVTQADDKGQYQFALPQGRYEVAVTDGRGRALSDAQSIDVPANPQQPVHLQPLRAKQAVALGAGEPGRAADEPEAPARRRAAPPPARSGRLPATPTTQPTASETGTTATAIRGRPATEGGEAPAADNAVERLEARVAFLEERLRELEARLGTGGPPAARTGEQPAAAAGAPAGAGRNTADDRQSGPFGPGRGGGDKPFVVTKNAELKGRLGRIVVTFPEGSKANSTHVEIMQAGGAKAIDSDYGACQKDVLPGFYDVAISKKRVARVEVLSGSESRVKAGVLHVQAGKDTRVDVFDADQKTQLTGGYGDESFGLPAGHYHVKIAGQMEAVEIRDGETTDF